MKKKRKVSHFSLKPTSLKLVIFALIVLALPISIFEGLHIQNTQIHRALLGVTSSGFVAGGSGIAIPVSQNTQTNSQGCFYKWSSCSAVNQCHTVNGVQQCIPCDPIHILVCPSVTPDPQPSCIPIPPQCKPGSPLMMNCPNPPSGGWCPSVTPDPQPSCIPMPPQCKAGSRLGIMCPSTPMGGWCLPSVTPTLTVTPPVGCYISGMYDICPLPHTNPSQCSFHPICRDSIPQCGVPDHIGQCPSVTVSLSITPVPTCIPRPSCLAKNPACVLPQPAGGWCPQTTQPLSSTSISLIIVYLNTLLRHLLGL